MKTKLSSLICHPCPVSISPSLLGRRNRREIPVTRQLQTQMLSQAPGSPIPPPPPIPTAHSLFFFNLKKKKGISSQKGNQSREVYLSSWDVEHILTKCTSSCVLLCTNIHSVHIFLSTYWVSGRVTPNHSIKKQCYETELHQPVLLS